jgi:PAS domain S-box-containing protein
VHPEASPQPALHEPALDAVFCRGAQVGDPQQLLAAAAEAYVAVDHAGRVVGWNPAAEATFGYSRAQACGRRLDELIVPDRYTSTVRQTLARLSAGGQPVAGRRIQRVSRHADGHKFPIEVSVAVTTGGAGPVLHLFARDVTVAQRAARFANVEQAVSRGLAEAHSTGAAAGRVVEALGVRMGWPVAELWLADEARQLLCCAARHTTGKRVLGRFALDELELGVALPGRVHASGRLWWIPDLAADTASPRSRAAARAGLHVAVGVPIGTGAHRLGALCVYGDRAEDPEDTLIGLLSGLAAQIGQYWERRRAEELTVELARTKDEFLALVTHELRNPLSIITGTLGVLDEDLDSLDPGGLRTMLATIARSADRLNVMSQDLLDLARLEAGHLNITPAPTDLREIITACRDGLTRPAEQKQLTVTLDMPAPLPLHADADRLRQAADNLLSNTIKYTPAGGTITITATVDASLDAMGQQWITWSVADTGIGVPAAEQPRLFRRFYRASTAVEQRIPGTGLGLVITRTIVERHHGTVGLGEHVGPGTTFTIHLPTKPPA